MWREPMRTWLTHGPHRRSAPQGMILTSKEMHLSHQQIFAIAPVISRLVDNNIKLPASRQTPHAYRPTSKTNVESCCSQSRLAYNNIISQPFEYNCGCSNIDLYFLLFFNQ